MRILIDNYDFHADMRSLSPYVQEMGEYYIDHELAVSYLGMQISFMDKSSQAHQKQVQKYVRVAKQAYLVKSAKNEQALEYLLDAVRKFGIDPDKIEPRPL